VLIERGTPEGQAEAYASAIASLIRQPVRMRALGRAGRERVERYFRIEQMHQNMLTMLLEAMRRHRTWPGAVPTPEAARESARQSVDHVYRAREEEVRRGKTGPPASVGGRMRRALSRWVQALLARDVTQEPELSPTSTRA
jgi:hypothetical protein